MRGLPPLASLCTPICSVPTPAMPTNSTPTTGRFCIQTILAYRTSAAAPRSTNTAAAA
eukprot:CAMPEP_0184540350 /NCGR_PEP_ID=MMETSP0199_2-20130426/337_1 /TAXON_ID=1112570 /ORGANISM="Thraustochytrium sp., Strain LLF1b" /LENGTH=57 /DNA_ID=CAMNT_0026933927 /DNA_START=220 /DNA_END=390 /DNA_ORIENTATION=-